MFYIWLISGQGNHDQLNAAMYFWHAKIQLGQLTPLPLTVWHTWGLPLDLSWSANYWDINKESSCDTVWPYGRLNWAFQGQCFFLPAHEQPMHSSQTDVGPAGPTAGRWRLCWVEMQFVNHKRPKRGLHLRPGPKITEEALLSTGVLWKCINPWVSGYHFKSIT